jgi:hypothetical protein
VCVLGKHHFLSTRLETLKELNIGRGLFRCFATEYNSYIESFTRHELPALLATHFVDDHMEKALVGVKTCIRW